MQVPETGIALFNSEPFFAGNVNSFVYLWILAFSSFPEAFFRMPARMTVELQRHCSRHLARARCTDEPGEAGARETKEPEWETAAGGSDLTNFLRESESFTQ